MDDPKDFKSLFMRIYANLPLGSREEIIAVIDNEPITWKAAKLEIEFDTPKAQKILEFLSKIGILHK